MVKISLFHCLIVSLSLIFPLGQLTRLPLARGEVNIYWHDLIVFFLLLSWLIKKAINKEKFYFPKLTKPILGFICIAAFSLFLSFPHCQNRELGIASLYLLRWIFYSGIYFVLSDLYRFRIECGMTKNNLLIISGVIAAVLGLLQYMFFPDIRSLTMFGWDPHYYRLV